MLSMLPSTSSTASLSSCTPETPPSSSYGSSCLCELRTRPPGPLCPLRTLHRRVLGVCDIVLRMNTPTPSPKTLISIHPCVRSHLSLDLLELVPCSTSSEKRRRNCILGHHHTCRRKKSVIPYTPAVKVTARNPSQKAGIAPKTSMCPKGSAKIMTCRCCVGFIEATFGHSLGPRADCGWALFGNRLIKMLQNLNLKQPQEKLHLQRAGCKSLRKVSHFAAASFISARFSTIVGSRWKEAWPRLRVGPRLFGSSRPFHVGCASYDPHFLPPVSDTTCQRVAVAAIAWRALLVKRDAACILDLHRRGPITGIHGLRCKVVKFARKTHHQDCQTRKSNVRHQS